MNIYFLKNWQFNHKSAPPLLNTYQKTVITIWQNMKVNKTQKYQFFNSLVNWDKFAITAYANIQKYQYSITFMSWKKLWNPTRATLTSNNFQSFGELAKSLKDQHSKIPILNLRINWKMLCPNLSFSVENWGNLYTIRLFTF